MQVQKSYENSEKGKLYIIPTPIGNVEDITLRSINILKYVDVIYSEDTRETKKLLDKLDIKKVLISCHKYNENKIKNDLVKELKTGKNLALVTDRGTPLISDPGFIVSKFCIENGIDVIALPGASALLPALNMSGIESNHFLFYGFLNNKDSIVKKEMKDFLKFPYTIVIYESPHRIIKTLENMFSILGNRNISISREISKIYEEVFRGTIEEALNYYLEPKGEFVIILEKAVIEEEYDENILLTEIEELIKSGNTNKDAVQLISKKYNISKNLLYNKFERKRKN